MMHQIRSLRIILLILGFVLVAFGCATSKSRQPNVDIGLKAETVPEGICLTFDYIPPETARLFIMFQTWGEKELLTSTHDITASHADIRRDTLKQIKQTGKVIFPFVKAGNTYRISASFENGEGQVLAGIPEWIYAECVADNGIYFNDDIALRLNETHTGVTLSSEPVFSAEVQFAPQKIGYTVHINKGEGESWGYRDEALESTLTWEFEPRITDELQDTDYLESGDYDAYVTAFCNIMYDNVLWGVELAKSPVFTYSY